MHTAGQNDNPRKKPLIILNMAITAQVRDTQKKTFGINLTAHKGSLKVTTQQLGKKTGV
jgi:hypothetical protein